MSDDEKCPMMLMEVEVARHGPCTYEDVANGLFKAGALKSVSIVGRYGASDEQIEALRSWCGGLFDVELDERDEDFDVLKRRLFEAQEAVRMSYDATVMVTARNLVHRVLIAFDVLDELQHAPKSLKRELGEDIFVKLRRELRDFLRPPVTLAPPAK